MNAERVLKHYEKIADGAEAIARLRRFILDLAVRGKLVPQDANDEPASDLLKRIAKEKARLVKVREVADKAALPAVPEDEIPLVFLPPGVGSGFSTSLISLRAAHLHGTTHLFGTPATILG